MSILLWICVYAVIVTVAEAVGIGPLALLIISIIVGFIMKGFEK